MPDGARWSYRPALDGVRTVAVYLVVLFHSGLAAATGGFVGVDLFFVLSGFLITNVLLDDVDESGTIRFGRFYARRARRLLPAAVLAIVVTSLVAVLLVSIVRRLSFVGDAQSALLYVANWHFLRTQHDYFATDAGASPFLHYWSLSIEEQFYLVFPLLLLGLVRLGRRRRGVPLLGLLVLCALSLAAQLWWSGSDPDHAYYGTDARVYQLLAGAALAYALRGARLRRPRGGHRRPTDFGRAIRAAAVPAVGAILLLGSGLVDLAVSTRGLAATAAGAVLVAALTLRGEGLVGGVLGHPAVAYLGRISYGTYLWHWPVVLVLRETYGLASPVVALGGGLVATALAAVSYHLVELPVRRSRSLGRIGWPTVAAGVSLCAAVAVAVVPPVLTDPRHPVVTAAGPNPPAAMSDAPVPEPPPPEEEIGRVDRERIPTDLDWRALVEDTGRTSTCEAAKPDACVVVHGTGPHILLVGDSHASMLAPMMIRLADEHGFTLSMNIVPSCPWQAKLATLWQRVAEQRDCDRARDVWYREALPALDPDVVLLAEYARDDRRVYGRTLRRIGGSGETLHQLLRNTTDETLRRITATGARALILKSIIVSRFDPLDCLATSTYVDRCEVTKPREPRFLDRVVERAATRSPRTFTFEVNDVVCPAPRRCDPLVDGINVWSNVNHYSTRILRHFRAAIWARIVRTGVVDGLPAG